MHLDEWQFLSVPWLWWEAAFAGLLLIWSLAPLRRPKPGRQRRVEATGTIAIYSLLWVYPPVEVVSLLRKQPGVRDIQLDDRGGVARVAFDPHETSEARLQDFVDRCAHHCRGERSAPHSCPTDLNRP
jgi:hypothetical protein